MQRHKLGLLVLLLALVLLGGCKSQKKAQDNRRHATTHHATTHTPSTTTPKGAQAVIKAAKGYLGVKYKYGGTTRAGFDCSGLMYVCFKEAGYTIPRVSRDQATVGRSVRLSEVQPGDLLFFSTSGKARRGINHVGVVVSTNAGNNIEFIHASTSMGVVVSSMNVNYYKKAFVKAVHPKFY